MMSRAYYGQIYVELDSVQSPEVICAVLGDIVFAAEAVAKSTREAIEDSLFGRPPKW
jgi:hypothetical protein